jgi:hypothetical protein
VTERGTGQRGTGQRATGQRATGQRASGRGQRGPGQRGTGQRGTGQRGTGQLGQTLVVFALVLSMFFVWMIALVGDAGALYVAYNRLDDAALLAAQSGASAIDAAQLYQGTLRLDVGRARLACQQALDAAAVPRRLRPHHGHRRGRGRQGGGPTAGDPARPGGGRPRPPRRQARLRRPRGSGEHVTQRRLLAAALTLVVLAVIGLLYLQALSLTRATRAAWMVTRDLPAGAALGGGDLKQVRIPAAGDQFIVLTEDPTNRRAAHPLRAQTLLSPVDVLSREMVQVPVSVRASPSVGAGDTVDLYALVGSRAVLVGRRLVVIATGSPLTVLVPAQDEAYWIALQANNVALFASRSDGVGVPESGGVSASDAIAGLAGTAPPPPSPPPPSPPPAATPSPR